MYRRLYYSKYVHILENNGVYALYNSLKMKPIYLTKETYLFINNLIINNMILESSFNEKESLSNIIKEMKSNKILIEDNQIDSKIIEKFRNIISKPYIQIAYFIMAENCNLACSYCFLKNNTQENKNIDKKYITKDILKKGLDLFSKEIKKDMNQFNNEKNIIIYGGEPLLNFEKIKYLVTLIKEYKESKDLPQKLNISIVTNGTLINKEIANFFKKENINVAVSLDGADSNTNKCRVYQDNSPAYKNIMNGISNLENCNCDYGLSITLTEETIKDFDQIKNLVVDHNIKSLGFNILMTEKNSTLSEDYNENAANFMIKAFEYFRANGIYEDRLMRKVNSFINSKLYLFDCGASGGNQIVIAPNGDIGICHGYLHNREYFVTNVNQDNIDITSTDTYLEWNKRTPLNMDVCQECIALGICGGGCPANAKNNNLTIWDLDERFCIHSKKTLEWLIWDLYKKSTS